MADGSTSGQPEDGAPLSQASDSAAILGDKRENGDISNEQAAGEPVSGTSVAQDTPASDALTADKMTGLAVAEEPITESAKAVERVETTAGSTTITAQTLSDDIAVIKSPGDGDVVLDHTASVDAPTSDLRSDPEPASNPAMVENQDENHDAIMDNVANGNSPTKPESPISLPEERQPESKPELKDGSAVVPTPPLSKSASPARATEANGVKDESEGASSGTKHDRAEDSGEPAAKRARVDEGSPAAAPAAVTSAEEDPQRKMTPNRQKYCLVLLRQLKKNKDAPPFLQPVDPVKLKIPDYFKIVTNPQDLSTIESTLKKNEYNTIDEFIDAVQLVWSNCQRYNGAESAINLMALRLKEQFERQIRSMPPPEPQDSNTPGMRGTKGKKTGKASGATPVSARQRKTSSPAANSGVPTIRRESMGVDGRPKREIHAPPPKSLPYQSAPRPRGKNAAQLKFCGQVLKELTSKKHEDFAFPFYQPVDAKALKLHDYHTVIRNPMDLGTIGQKLNSGEYESADDFEYDIRLVFRNCYKYNGPGSPVNTMGKRLESVFNEKWAEKPIPRPEGYGSDSEEESDVDDASKQTVQMLTKQLEAMKNQIASINSQKKKKKSKKSRYDDDEDGGLGPRDHDFKPTKKGGRKRRDSFEEADESPMFPTFEQKTALSTKMGYMTEHQMPVVIQILKRTDPNFDPEDEEVELDVDKVHPKTIRLLWNWIMDDVQPSFMRKKAPKAKKNRVVLSETEQQRQIEQLEAQLHKFDGGDSYGHVSRYGNHQNDDSSDSDSDASSEEDD